MEAEAGSGEEQEDDDEIFECEYGCRFEHADIKVDTIQFVSLRAVGLLFDSCPAVQVVERHEKHCTRNPKAVPKPAKTVHKPPKRPAPGKPATKRKREAARVPSQKEVQSCSDIYMCVCVYA